VICSNRRGFNRYSPNFLSNSHFEIDYGFDAPNLQSVVVSELVLPPMCIMRIAATFYLRFQLSLCLEWMNVVALIPTMSKAVLVGADSWE
jgi:hypothetical protein